jgi:hypothetical protein
MIYLKVNFDNQTLKNMKKNILKTIVGFVLLTTFASCAFHSGMMNNSVQLNQNNFKYVRNAYGEAKTTKVLGIGGNDRDALVAEAKKDLLDNYPLKEGQALANIVVDFKTSLFLVIIENKVTVTADIVEFK